MHDLVFDPVIIGTINGRPVFRIAGGSATFPADDGGGMDIEVDDPTRDVDDDDDDDRRVADDDDDDDDDDRRDEGEQRVPKAELDRAKAALKNERRERKKLQRQYEEQVNALKSETTEASVIEVEKAKIQVKNERDAYWTEEIVRAKAEAEFAAQGATSEMAERLAGLVKLKNVEWDEANREWDGLEDEVDAIINANPEFFKGAKNEEPAPNRRQLPGRPRVDGASRGGSGGGAPRKRPRSADLLAGQAGVGPAARRRR